MARVRTFVGVEVSSSVRGKVAALQQALARSGADVRWQDAANLHVTLLFLGDVDERELGAVCRAVAKAAATEPPFTLTAAGVGAFPNARRPKTVWAGITDGAGPLQRLNAALEERMLELGCYRQEERGYTPHLTLGRAKRDADGFALASEIPKRLAWDGGATTVDEVLVYSSETGRDGPEYAVIGRAPLSGKPA